MSREIYDQVDEVKTAIYKLVDLIRRHNNTKEAAHLAKYSYIEINPAYDSLFELGGNDERTGNSTEDRPSHSLPTGHDGGTL